MCGVGYGIRIYVCVSVIFVQLIPHAIVIMFMYKSLECTYVPKVNNLIFMFGYVAYFYRKDCVNLTELHFPPGFITPAPDRHLWYHDYNTQTPPGSPSRYTYLILTRRTLKGFIDWRELYRPLSYMPKVKIANPTVHRRLIKNLPKRVPFAKKIFEEQKNIYMKRNLSKRRKPKINAKSLRSESKPFATKGKRSSNFNNTGTDVYITTTSLTSLFTLDRNIKTSKNISLVDNICGKKLICTSTNKIGFNKRNKKEIQIPMFFKNYQKNKKSTYKNIFGIYNRPFVTKSRDKYIREETNASTFYTQYYTTTPTIYSVPIKNKSHEEVSTSLQSLQVKENENLRENLFYEISTTNAEERTRILMNSLNFRLGNIDIMETIGKVTEMPLKVLNEVDLYPKTNHYRVTLENEEIDITPANITTSKPAKLLTTYDTTVYVTIPYDFFTQTYASIQEASIYSVKPTRKHKNKGLPKWITKFKKLEKYRSESEDPDSREEPKGVAKPVIDKISLSLNQYDKNDTILEAFLKPLIGTKDIADVGILDKKKLEVLLRQMESLKMVTMFLKLLVSIMKNKPALGPANIEKVDSLNNKYYSNHINGPAKDRSEWPTWGAIQMQPLRLMNEDQSDDPDRWTYPGRQWPPWWDNFQTAGWLKLQELAPTQIMWPNISPQYYWVRNWVVAWLIMDLLWTISTVILLIGALIRIKGPASIFFYTPFTLVTFFIIVMDVVCAGFFFVSIGSSQNFWDYLNFVGVLNVGQLRDPKRCWFPDYKLTFSHASWLICGFFIRFVFFWALNIIIFCLIIHIFRRVLALKVVCRNIIIPPKRNIKPCRSPCDFSCNLNPCDQWQQTNLGTREGIFLGEPDICQDGDICRGPFHRFWSRPSYWTSAFDPIGCINRIWNSVFN